MSYEVLKLHLRDTFTEELSNAKLNYLLQFGAEESYPLNIDVDQCKALLPVLEVDTVHAQEICTIRQMAELETTESTCYVVSKAVNYTRKNSN